MMLEGTRKLGQGFLVSSRSGEFFFSNVTVYRTVHVWLFVESTQELLLQKRADCKDSWPGLWDISSAGHISDGDTSLMTARRAPVWNIILLALRDLEASTN